MAVAAVTGLQGNRDEEGYINFTSNILSTSKHFAAYGKTEAGQDGTAADISERTLREIYLPAFKAVVNAGVGGIMPSHNEIDGTPSHGNRWLLTVRILFLFIYYLFIYLFIVKLFILLSLDLNIK